MNAIIHYHNMRYIESLVMIRGFSRAQQNHVIAFTAYEASRVHMCVMRMCVVAGRWSAVKQQETRLYRRGDVRKFETTDRMSIVSNLTRKQVLIITRWLRSRSSCSSLQISRSAHV